MCEGEDVGGGVGLQVLVLLGQVGGHRVQPGHAGLNIELSSKTVFLSQGEIRERSRGAKDGVNTVYISLDLTLIYDLLRTWPLDFITYQKYNVEY